MIFAIFFAVTSNGSVVSTTARLPNCSNVMPSCRLHVEQDPQSPKPVTMKSTSANALVNKCSGAGALALTFE